MSRSEEATPARGSLKRAAAGFALFAAYVATARLGFSLDPVGGGFATVVWPPAGIALAALVLGGSGLWPWVALGALTANLWNGGSLPVVLGIAAGNTLGALAGASALRRMDFRPSMDRREDVLGFVIAAAGASALSATAGLLSLRVGGMVSPGELLHTWLAWWVGDWLGDLVAGAAILCWAVFPRPSPSPRRWAEAGALLFSLVVIGEVFMAEGDSRVRFFSFPYFVLPPMIWAALRFGPVGAAGATLLMSVMAVSGAVKGHGPFGGESLHVRLLSLQVFMGVVSVTTLILAAMGRALRNFTDGLERKIESRTEELLRSNQALQDEVEQRRRTERELLKRESQLDQAQAISHVGSWQWDVVDNSLVWSDELCRIFGLLPDDRPRSYREFLGLVHPEDRDAVQEKVLRAGRELGLYAIEYRIIRPDGQVRWVHALGRVLSDLLKHETSHVGTAQDITERKTSEESLRKSEERFRLLVSGVKDYAIYMLDPEGRVASWNEGAQRIKGYRDREILGRHFSAFYPLSDIEADKPGMDLREAARVGRFEEDGWRVRKDGTRFWASAMITAIRNGSGVLVGFAKVTRDITERRLAEEAALRASEELEGRVVERTRDLEDANRKLRDEVSDRKRAEDSLRRGEDALKESLRVKETLLKEIHHRVKNNLQIVHSLLNLQARNVRDPEALEGMRDCRDRVRAMALVHEKLYRSRDLAHIDLADYLGDLSRGIAGSYGFERRSIALQVEAEPVLLGIDEAVPCGLIMYELLSNCFKHAFPEGRSGTVKVFARCAGDGSLVLGVADDGVGFPEDAPPRDPPALGFELVQSLVHQLGGKIGKSIGPGAEVNVTFQPATSAACA